VCEGLKICKFEFRKECNQRAEVSTGKIRYILKDGNNNILCTNTHLVHEDMVGPGGREAKIYKRKKAAENRASKLYQGIVLQINERGEVFDTST
jgi:hypothetical protein